MLYYPGSAPLILLLSPYLFGFVQIIVIRYQCRQYWNYSQMQISAGKAFWGPMEPVGCLFVCELIHHTAS